MPTNLSMAIVVRDRSVLFQRRFRVEEDFVFEFPGGAMESEESAEEAAIRELCEETGMVCNNVLGRHTFENEYGGEIHFIVLLDTNRIEAKQVKRKRQQTFYWFQLDDIPRTDLHASDIKFIDTYLKHYLLSTIGQYAIRDICSWSAWCPMRLLNMTEILDVQLCGYSSEAVARRRLTLSKITTIRLSLKFSECVQLECQPSKKTHPISLKAFETLLENSRDKHTAVRIAA